MNKSFLFLCLYFYIFMVFSIYSVPILLFPILAATQSTTTYFTAIVLSAFPLGSFPASLIAGKWLKFYKKYKVLFVAHVFFSFTILTFGLLNFIDDPYLFFIVAFFSRFIGGFSEGVIITIAYSFISDIYPDDTVVKIGMLETACTIGMMMGAPIAGLLYMMLGYLGVFASWSTFIFLFGFFIILFALRKHEMVVFDSEVKKSLPIKEIMKSKSVLLNFFYSFAFLFPLTMISPGYSTYMSTLTSNLYVSGFIYAFSCFGLMTGVLILKYLSNQRKYEKKMLFALAISSIIGLNFFGPDPMFGITDDNTKIILIGISFYITSIAGEVIYLLLYPILNDDVLEIFPAEKELCIEFVNGLSTAIFSLDEFLGSLIGGFLNDILGYNRTGTFYAIVALIYFILYWTCMRQKKNYDIMNEDLEVVKKEVIN